MDRPMERSRSASLAWLLVIVLTAAGISGYVYLSQTGKGSPQRATLVDGAHIQKDGWQNRDGVMQTLLASRSGRNPSPRLGTAGLPEWEG